MAADCAATLTGRVHSRGFSKPARTAPCIHSMRIITLNVNGIRAAERKGLARWLARGEPWDIVCLQEIKAAHDDIPRALEGPRKSAAAFFPARKKGYAGVGLYAKVPPRFATGSRAGGSATRSASPKSQRVVAASSRSICAAPPRGSPPS